MIEYTWHVAQAEVGDAVVVVEEDVEGVEGPGGLHQQARAQGHHQPGQGRQGGGNGGGHGGGHGGKPRDVFYCQ